MFQHTMNDRLTQNLMTRHKNDPTRLSTMTSGFHEGHVLLMEKGKANLTQLQNIRGIGMASKFFKSQIRGFFACKEEAQSIFIVYKL